VSICKECGKEYTKTEFKVSQREIIVVSIILQKSISPDTLEYLIKNIKDINKASEGLCSECRRDVIDNILSSPKISEKKI